MRKISFAIMIAVIIAASLAHGHGVTYGIFEERAMAVRFGYAGGEPMSYVEAKVFGPESSPDLEFQNGRTDARGVFAFVPDRPGTWQVVAWDNLGHKGSMEVVVGQDNAGLRFQSQAGGMKDGPAIVRILFALSVIGNLAFVIAYIKRPKVKHP